MPDFKLPPQNIEAESSLVGALLIDKNAILKVVEIIGPEDFYQPALGTIYETILELFEQRVPTDMVTVTDDLRKKKKLAQIGGAGFLSELVNQVPTAAHVARYAGMVHDKAVLRRLIESAEVISETAYDGELDVDVILDEAEQRIFEISQKNVRTDFVAMKSVLSSAFDRIDELHKNKGSLSGLATAYTELDRLLGGMQKSDLIILAARPSMGKTSLALNIAQNVATKTDSTVGVFSLEMSKEQLVDRLICAEAGLDLRRLRTGMLAEEDFQDIGRAMGVLGEAKIFIDDTPSINVLEMRTKSRRLQAEHGLDLLVVDYLQLMTGRSRSIENRVQEISEISRSLKGLARELRIPVLALSQLSRAVESRPSKIPMLSDLRESGSIEQDADVVAFIYRDEYYHAETTRENIADIIVAKHRNGPTGKLELFFRKEQTRFENLTQH